MLDTYCVYVRNVISFFISQKPGEIPIFGTFLANFVIFGFVLPCLTKIGFFFFFFFFFLFCFLVRSRAVASLSLQDGQDKNISSMFPHFHVVSLIFPQNFFIFFLILVCRVGGTPTRGRPWLCHWFGLALWRQCDVIRWVFELGHTSPVGTYKRVETLQVSHDFKTIFAISSERKITMT